VAQFLDWCLEPPAFYMTDASGWDKMSKSRAGMLRACGHKAGVPDILLFHDGRTYGIELKFAKGRLSAVQKATHEKMTAAGVKVFVCRTVEEVENELRTAGIPLRGTVHATTGRTSRQPGRAVLEQSPP
jgi:hypothetical protein